MPHRKTIKESYGMKTPKVVSNFFWEQPIAKTLFFIYNFVGNYKKIHFYESSQNRHFD